MRKTEKRNIFLAIFGSEFISKPVRRANDKKELTLLEKKRMIKKS